MRHFGRQASLLLAIAAVALVTVTGAAADSGTSTTMPVMYSGANPCTGEAFWGNGTVHTTLTDNLSASGNVAFHWDTTLDGLKAVTATGKTYVVHESFNWQFSFSNASEETFDIVAHYVRVGEDGTLVLGDDFYQYLRTHATANASGMPTAFQVSSNDVPDSCS